MNKNNLKSEVLRTKGLLVQQKNNNILKKPSTPSPQILDFEITKFWTNARKNLGAGVM